MELEQKLKHTLWQITHEVMELNVCQLKKVYIEEICEVSPLKWTKFWSFVHNKKVEFIWILLDVAELYM